MAFSNAAVLQEIVRLSGPFTRAGRDILFLAGVQKKLRQGKQQEEIRPHWLTAFFTATVTGKVLESEQETAWVREEQIKRVLHFTTALLPSNATQGVSSVRETLSFLHYDCTAGFHFCSMLFWTCKRASKSQRKVSDESGASLDPLLYQTPWAKLPPDLLPMPHGADAQILTILKIKLDIHSSVALGAQDPCFHKSFRSFDRRNSDGPWALLFMEDYEEQKTAHKGTEALTARQSSAMHKAQKHKSTEQPFVKGSGKMTIFTRVY